MYACSLLHNVIIIIIKAIIIATVDVSLKLFGVIVPNNSLVDIDDILYRARIDGSGYREHPTNNNPQLHDQALLYMTDLEDYCDVPHTVRSDWYFPDGNVVPLSYPSWLGSYISTEIEIQTNL